MTLVTNTKLIYQIGRIFALGVIFYTATFAYAEDEEKNNESITEQNTNIQLRQIQSDFEYRIDGRPDPFKPFLKPKITMLDPNEIIDADKVLTGMQLFEPGQLTLVAILQNSDAYIAMVQDSTGKGYVLKSGMKIGRRGEIIDIDADKVMIEETATTRSKKEIKTRIDMVLNKEGEQ